MRLDYTSAESLAPVIEALLFASDEPLSAQSLRQLILGEETPKTDVAQEETTEDVSSEDASESAEAAAEQPADGAATSEGAETPKKKRKRKQLIELPVIHTAVEQLNAQLEETSRPYRIIEIAGGYQFATRSDYAEYVARLSKEKSRRRLSGASLETLAIIAYKQPVSKLDIENIRGVNCDEVLKSLLEKNLITITGRAEAVGRPLLYGTTVDFLRHFGLHSIQDLPKPREIEELMKEESVKATTLEEAAKEFVDPEMQSQSITVDELIAEVKEEAYEEEAITPFSGIELDVEALEPGAGSESETLEVEELDEEEIDPEAEAAVISDDESEQA